MGSALCPVQATGHFLFLYLCQEALSGMCCKANASGWTIFVCLLVPGGSEWVKLCGQCKQLDNFCLFICARRQ